MVRIRTGYSFRIASGDLQSVANRLKEIGSEYAPITDRSSTFGFVRWNKLCKKMGLKPVFGVELPVTDSINAKKPATDYWTFIAKDTIQPINHLVEIATGQFRYQPLLTYEQAQNNDAIKIIGHRSLIDHIQPNTRDLYFALSPSSVRGYTNRLLAKGIRPVLCGDNRYPAEGDKGLWEVICGRNAERQSYPQHILSNDEITAHLGEWGYSDAIIEEARDNAAKILASLTAKLLTAELLAPNRPATLRAMCEAGAARLGVDLSSPVYAARLARELALIEEKQFEDYFYLVADICEFARANMLVGPARGSSCGSLVCYLLRITLVDPIPYGLIFERFIDTTRSDLPDIDLDFSDERRHLVFEYVIKKYGAERVARLGTVALFKPRSALAEASGALKIPKWKCDAVAEVLIERSSGDSRALNALEDTFTGTPSGRSLVAEYPEVMVVSKMEGHPRHYSQHAAGIVIASKPISNYVAVDTRTGATMCDKKDAEELGLLKVDALGLTQLSVFEDALELAGLDRDLLESIPMEDSAAFEVLNEAKFSGIFQFNGMALQSIAKQFKITQLDDIISITALARPGPLASGGALEWVKRRNGINPVEYPHPVFEPYLKDTLGVVLYQEQVMEIGRNVGGLNWDQVTALRKAMSKSLGKEFFDHYGDPWKAGAIALGVSPEMAARVWDDLCVYGSWSFNKSHAVAYGIISYQCCWLKAHYPFEFAAATLTHEKDPEKQIMLLREMATEGYDYVPIDPELSTDKWVVGFRDGKRVLVGPLQNVKGVGPKLVSSIIGARARGEKLSDRARKLLTNPKTDIDSLFPIRDAINRLMPDPTAKNIFTPMTPIIKIIASQTEQTFLIYCTPDKIVPRDENEAVLVAKRGFERKGDTAYLNLWMKDDTDSIYGKIATRDFKRLGQPIIDRGRPGKALYAIKGTVKLYRNSIFRALNITHIRYVGDIEDASI